MCVRDAHAAFNCTKVITSTVINTTASLISSESRQGRPRPAIGSANSPGGRPEDQRWWRPFWVRELPRFEWENHGENLDKPKGNIGETTSRLISTIMCFSVTFSLYHLDSDSKKNSKVNQWVDASAKAKISRGDKANLRLVGASVSFCHPWRWGFPWISLLIFGEAPTTIHVRSFQAARHVDFFWGRKRCVCN